MHKAPEVLTPTIYRHMAKGSTVAALMVNKYDIPSVHKALETLVPFIYTHDQRVNYGSTYDQLVLWDHYGKPSVHKTFDLFLFNLYVPVNNFQSCQDRSS